MKAGKIVVVLLMLALVARFLCFAEPVTQPGMAEEPQESSMVR